MTAASAAIRATLPSLWRALNPPPPPASTSRALVPYRPPPGSTFGPWLRRLGVFGIAVDALTPNQLGESSGDRLTPAAAEARWAQHLGNMAKRTREQRMGPPENYFDELTPIQQPPDMGPAEPEDDFDYDPRELADIVRNPREAIRNVAERAIERRLGGPTPATTPAQVPPQDFGPPRPVDRSPPTTAPPATTRPATPVRSQNPTPTAARSRRALQIGLSAGVLGLLAYGRRSGNSAAYNALGDAIGGAPLPAVPLPEAVGVPEDLQPGGAPSYFLSSSTSSGSSSCRCSTRKGPRYRCLERAQVVYRTGRRKGKSAGTKCVRFSTTPIGRY